MVRCAECFDPKRHTAIDKEHLERCNSCGIVKYTCRDTIDVELKPVKKIIVKKGKNK